MTEYTANAQKSCDAGQRHCNIRQRGELGDQKADDRAGQTQRDAGNDGEQILHGDTPFQV